MADGFDARLAEALADDIEGLTAELRKAMTSTVRVRSTDPCPHSGCGCRHFRDLEVPDYRTKLQIAEWWANRGFGRPGQQDSPEEGDRVVFQRLVEMPVEGADG